MKSNAPWSVKGIERDARETAKEAARREGMTVGEWLNQMIYSQAEGSGSDLSGGEVEGLKLKDLVTAMEHLRNRVAQAETKNSAAVAELSRNMGGFVERVQRLERVKPAEGTHQDLAQRLEKLERAGGDRHRIEALKALEKAVTQVATQFNSAQRTTLNRLDSAEAQLQEFAERLDRVGDGGNGEPAEFGALKSTVEDLAERVANAERIAEEAASLKGEAAESADPEFVERTGARLRVLGDELKRGGDQIRAMEGAIAKLSGQIEAAEKRSADGVQKVSETIAEVRAELSKESAGAGAQEVESKLAEARRETDQRLEELQRSLETLNARFDNLDHAAPAETAATPAPPAASDDDGDDLSAEIEDALTETPASRPAAALRAPAAKIVTQEPDDVAEEIEDALAAIEAETGDEPEPETEASADAQIEPETDPFAFSDEIEEDNEDDVADDFSFQLDEDAAEAGDDGDITVSADETENAGDDETSKDARSLLAEVRSALSGDTYTQDAQDDDDDDDISALFAEDDEDGEDDDNDDEDRQAPNTASLAEGIAPEATEDPAAEEAPKEDMVQAARRRAREAAEQREAEGNRPRRSQLTAKQRAILAARARQKRAAEAGLEAQTPTPSPAQEPQKEASPAALADFEDDEEEEKASGRFGKIAAALSSARARLGRKKDDEDKAVETPEPADERIKFDDDEEPRRNGDRAALETLQSTASAKPLTMALAVAIVLAIAALAYLMKDFLFQPQDAAPAPTQTERPAETAAETGAPAQDQGSLATVPEAPALDPQQLYLESMDALSAAQTEDDAMSAVSKLQDAAALGFPPAQLQLGELYKTGQGVDQDLGQARVWFRRAANGGNVLAMHRIGVMTARGDGGAADAQEAIAWFEQAANFGLVDSQYNLGAIYHPSDDAASSIQDAAQAYYWYSLAARNGDDQAQPLAAGVGVALSPDARAEIDARVASWTAKPADQSANASAAVN